MTGKNSIEAAILLCRLILVFPFIELKKITRKSLPFYPLSIRAAPCCK